MKKASSILTNPTEFKIRMLAMKNATPSLYNEIYNNLKEMNVIALDTMPNTDISQEFSPGQIPENMQGGTSATESPASTESGANPQSVEGLPEARPPRSTERGI